MSRDFLSLSPREVLALGIHIERANARRFRAFADAFDGHDSEVVELFRLLAAEEEQHEQFLASRFEETFAGEIPEVDEMSVDGVIESIDLDDAEHMIFGSLQPAKVFELALQAEQQAWQFYTRAAALGTDPELVALYREMEQMEVQHASWVREKLRKCEAL